MKLMPTSSSIDLAASDVVTIRVRTADAEAVAAALGLMLWEQRDLLTIQLDYDDDSVEVYVAVGDIGAFQQSTALVPIMPAAWTWEFTLHTAGVGVEAEACIALLRSPRHSFDVAGPIVRVRAALDATDLSSSIHAAADEWTDLIGFAQLRVRHLAL